MPQAKPLNETQKKVLAKIFNQKIENAKKSLEHSGFVDKEKRKALISGKTNPTIKRLTKIIIGLRDKLKVKEKELTKIGFEVNSRGDNEDEDNLGRLYISYGSPIRQKIDKDFSNRMESLEQLKTQVLTDIHCLELDVKEIGAKIDKEIAKLLKI